MSLILELARRIRSEKLALLVLGGLLGWSGAKWVYGDLAQQTSRDLVALKGERIEQLKDQLDAYRRLLSLQDDDATRMLKEQLERRPQREASSTTARPRTPGPGPPATGKPAPSGGDPTRALQAITEARIYQQLGHRSQALSRYLDAYHLLPDTVRQRLDKHEAELALAVDDPNDLEQITVSIGHFDSLFSDQATLNLLKGGKVQ